MSIQWHYPEANLDYYKYMYYTCPDIIDPKFHNYIRLLDSDINNNYKCKFENVIDKEDYYEFVTLIYISHLKGWFDTYINEDV